MNSNGEMEMNSYKLNENVLRQRETQKNAETNEMKTKIERKISIVANKLQ